MTPTFRDQPDEQRERRRKALAAVFVVLLVVAVAGTVGFAIQKVGRSQAAFGDLEDLGVNHLGAATLDLAVGERTALLEARDMAPGDRAIGTIELVNAGTLPLRYALLADTSASELTRWLTLDLWVGDDCELGVAGVPQGAEVLLRGNTITSGGASWVGDVAVGAQAGDRVLLPAQRETLCVAVELPINAPNDAMGLEMTQLVTAAAEHAVELSQ
jgi:hypothetical protein